MEEQIQNLFLDLCKEYNLPAIPIIFVDLNTKDTGEYDSKNNRVGFNVRRIRLDNCLERTVRHEFRHYWQRCQGFLEPWKILSKGEQDQATKLLIHPLEEDSKEFSVHPDLGVHTEIVLSAEPLKVRLALNSNIRRVQVRKKISQAISVVRKSLLL